jgi:hypothetical protein
VLCRYYQLAPIAVEDYSGTDQHSFYAVAVARKTDSHLTIFNLKRMFSIEKNFFLLLRECSIHSPLKSV